MGAHRSELALPPARECRQLWRGYVVASLLIALLLGLQTAHYRDFNYQLDEIITIHRALDLTPREVVLWMATDNHPPLWRLTATTWVTAFGKDEHITRFLSTLYTALTLALTYRLGRDLFGHRAALVAVFILGSLAFYQFYSREFRSYTALAMFGVACHLTFLRWVRGPTFARALLFVLAGIGALYTHFFGWYVILAQAIVMLILVRFNRGLYLRAAGLFAAVALSFVAWLPSFIYSFTVRWGGGISYYVPTRWDALRELYGQMQIRPVEIGGLILFTGFFMPVRRVFTAVRPIPIFRFGADWRRWYVALLVLVMLILVFTANLLIRNATGRNLTVILPAASIFAAYALFALPGPARAAALVMIAVPALTSPVFYVAHPPYKEVLSFIRETYRPDSRVVINNGLRNYFDYYLADWLPTDPAQIWMVRREMVTPDDLLDDTQATSASERSESLRLYDSYQTFLQNAEQLWYLETSEAESIGDDYHDLIVQQYIPLRSATFPEPDYLARHTITEYRRIPRYEAVYTFGDTFTLQAWRVRSEVNVQPCQSIPVETWWTASAIPDTNYSLTVVLAGGDGVGVNQTDGSPAGVLTRLWQPDAPYLDERAIVVPCDSPPGEYPLLVGLYDQATVTNLPITTRDGAPVGTLGYLTTIHVQ